MIIDAHHHLWQFNENDYGWMDDSMEILKRDYLPVDLLTETKRAGISGTVVVQARQKTEETSWLLEIADANPLIKGVVGWVDLRSANVKDQLDRFSGHPKLVGVRHVIHDEPDLDFMLHPEFKRGIALLSEYQLVYDLLLFPEHLKNATKLAEMFPDQRFVLDHMSKPRIRSGVLQPWKEDIEALSAHPNVWCKISGMVTEADKAWKYGDFVPYMKVIIDSFGADRVMLGSDWPVCRLAGEYETVMGIPMVYMRTMKEEEKERIFYKNAMDCYQLNIN